MGTLLLAVFKFAAFLAILGIAAVVLGAGASANSDVMRRLRGRVKPLPSSDLDPAVAAALELKRDVQRGQSDTDQILASTHGSDSGGGGDSGGGDGGGD